VAQKLLSTFSKLRSAEDKVVKALPTWTEPDPDDLEDEDSRSNLVSCAVFEDASGYSVYIYIYETPASVCHSRNC